jgi:hypothetical protein
MSKSHFSPKNLLALHWGRACTLHDFGLYCHDGRNAAGVFTLKRISEWPVNESSRFHSPRKKTSAPNTALATIASHKARGVVS